MIDIKVILISGKAESGKDFVATEIKKILENRNMKPFVIHFADSLKFICKEYFGWDGKKDEYGRSLLQEVSNNIIKKKDYDFFANIVKTIVSSVGQNYDFVIIPDLRFKNELKIMKDNFNSYTIRVERSRHNNILNQKQKNNESEVQLDNYEFDFYIKEEDISSKIIEICKIMEVLLNG